MHAKFRGEQQLEDFHLEFKRREWAGAYQNTAAYPDGFYLECEGHLPKDLQGTLYRNGPGVFRHGQDLVTHPFDGHGLLAAVRFQDGKAFFRSRFVETQDHRDETEANRILYPGTFGTKPSGGFFRNVLGAMSLRNPANTGLLLWGGKFLALFEAGQPHRCDPDSLATQGVDLLGGIAQRGAPFSSGSRLVDQCISWCICLLGVGKNMEGGFKLGGHAVSAHPVEDTIRKRLVIFTYRLQLGFLAFQFFLFGYLCTIWLPGLVTKLRIHEFDENFDELATLEQDLPGYAFLHDLSLSKQHYVIFCNPVRLRMLPLLLGLEAPACCIEWTHQPAKILLFQRQATGGSPLGKLASNRASKCVRADSATELLAGIAACKEVEADAAASWKVRVDEPEQCMTFSCPSPAFVFHQSNAFCQDDHTVVVDCIRYPNMPDFKQGSGKGETFMDCVDPEVQPISQLHRYTIDLQTSVTSEQLLCERAMEFPAVSPDYTGRKHRYVYTAAALHPNANRPQQAICKLDLEAGGQQLWSRGPGYYCGEPVFVPRPCGRKEDDGWILAINFDALRKTSECVVLSASNLELLATCNLQHILPHGLHGTWSAD